jgi:hypothetical protein
MLTSLTRHLLIILIMLFSVWTNVRAQDILGKMLNQNCELVGIDACYRDGGNRFIHSFLSQIHGVVPPAEWVTVGDIDIQAVADKNVLRAIAFVDASGKRKIEMSSAVLFYFQSISYSAVFQTLNGNTEGEFNLYLKQLVSNLVENSHRQKLGQAVEAPKTFAQAIGISPSDEKRIMDSEKGRGLSALFFQGLFLWALSHEIGHHVLGHLPRRANTNVDEIRKQERDADRFATRLVLKLGYALAPVIPGLTYFSAIEKWGVDGVEDRTHPPADCRLADVLDTAIEEYGREVPGRDGLSRAINEMVLKNPQTPQVIENLRSAHNGCRG